MTDDLKERLRNGIVSESLHEDNETELFDIDAANELCEDALERIEKLEAANLRQSLIKVDDMRRIEKLEAALREIAGARPECCCISDAMQFIARKALEGKDD